MSSFISNTLTLLGLALIGGLGYYLFVIQGESVLLSEDRTISTIRVANEQFLRQLDEIKRIELPDGIFADPRFRSFVDYSLPVPPQSLGRDNPFAPVE